MTNTEQNFFKQQAESIASIYGLKNLDDLSFAALESLCHEYRDLTNQMLEYILGTTEERNVSNNKNIEQKMLRATRGVFKYMSVSSSKGYVCYTSSKNKLVQVGYLDLDNNIVFDDVKRPVVDESDAKVITRFLPGFQVRGYRSCEDYIPSLTAPSQVTKEIKEVVSTTTILYSPSSYGTTNQETYSVVGFLNDENELIQYNQIIEEQSN